MKQLFKSQKTKAISILSISLLALGAMTTLMIGCKPNPGSPLPDLIFDKMSSQDHCTLITFSVKNSGNFDAGAFKINVINNSNGTIVQTFSVPSLKMNQSVSFSFQKDRARSDWGISIDPDNRITELEEGNNGRSVFCPE